jgi:hypothetical protein
MMWVRQLALAASELYGTSRTVIIYTISSIVGFLLSSSAGLIFGATPIFFLRGAALTIGASAPIFGLLGALVVYGRRGGSSYIGGQAKTYAVILFVFGFIMPGIDNYAHLGGFLGGYATARWLDAASRARDHLIVAILARAYRAFNPRFAFPISRNSVGAAEADWIPIGAGASPCKRVGRPAHPDQTRQRARANCRSPLQRRVKVLPAEADHFELLALFGLVSPEFSASRRFLRIAVFSRARRNRSRPRAPRHWRSSAAF